MTGPRARTAGLVALVLVVAVVLAGGGYLITRVLRAPQAAPTAPRSPLPAVAGPATQAPPTGSAAPAGTPPSPGALARRLGPALTAAALGPQVRAQVIDVLTGRTLLDRDGGVSAPPASTAKLLTAAAVLAVRRPTDRLPTTVLLGSGTDTGTVYLRGGGDPTLTAAAPGRPGAYAQAARLDALAAAVRRSGAPVRRIVVDDGRFTGPAVSPDWAPEDVPSDYGAAITAVMVDGGRATPSAGTRSATPDLDAGRALATLTGHPAVTVSRGATPVTARAAGTVTSAPISVLVGQMLLDSDNVIAECLARAVAVAEHLPVTFAGAARAIRTVIGRVAGVDPGAGMRDGSGLAAADRLSPRTLTALLRAVATGRSVSLRSVIAGLPVAGWSGTLTDRYVRGSQQAAAGEIRAKTGTLSGVSALAGVVHDRDGRLLAFAFIAPRTGPTPAAEAAMDGAATSLATCGCR